MVWLGVTPERVAVAGFAADNRRDSTGWRSRGGEFRLGDDELRLRVAEDVGDFRRGQAPVDRHHHGAGLDGTREKFEIRRAVLADPGDAITRAHPRSREPVRHAAGARIEFRIGEDRVTVAQGDLGAALARQAAQDRVEGGAVHPGKCPMRCVALE